MVLSKSDQKPNLKFYAFSFLTLFIITALIHLPFLFIDVINWDESTLILIGQSILKGHLPYLDLWDLKPPLAFVSYSLIIQIFGKSILGVRLGGVFCITIVSFVFFIIAEKYYQRSISILLGISCILSISYIPSGQGTPIETIALVPLTIAFYLLLCAQSPTITQAFFVGGFIAISTLIRLNLAYVSLIIGLLILVKSIAQNQSFRSIFYLQISYYLSQLIIILATFVPYAITGNANTWWNSVVLASLSYANSRSENALHIIVETIKLWSSSNRFIVFLLIFSLIAIFSGIFYFLIWFYKHHYNKMPISDRHLYSLTFIFTIGITFTIFKTGVSHFHYWIQVSPFFCLLCVIILSTLVTNLNVKKSISLFLVSSWIVLSIVILQKNYLDLFDRISHHKNLTTGTSYQIAEYLNHNSTKDDLIYMTIDHIAYWFINKEPLTKCTTHPSIITKTYLVPYCGQEPNATPVSEMQAVFALHPKFVVRTQALEWYFEDQPQVVGVLEQHLQQEYQLDPTADIDDRRIYRRIDTL